MFLILQGSRKEVPLAGQYTGWSASWVEKLISLKPRIQNQKLSTQSPIQEPPLVGQLVTKIRFQLSLHYHGIGYLSK